MPGVPSQYTGEPLGAQYEREKTFSGGGGGLRGAQGVYSSAMGSEPDNGLGGDLSALVATVEGLSQEVAELCARLTPLCKPAGPLEKNPSVAGPVRSQLSVAITDITARLIAMRHQLVDTRNRLEV